jgi:hypothetical protein
MLNNVKINIISHVIKRYIIHSTSHLISRDVVSKLMYTYTA